MGNNITKLYRSIDFWFGLILWHIKHYGWFNAKSFLYKYIEYRIYKGILLITIFKRA